MNRPLLYLDVDGPLNPFAAKPQRRPPGYVTIRVPWEGGIQQRLLRVWLNPEHGPALLDLGFDLCWATTWMDLANRWIGPVLGLPELPFVDFGDALFAERPDGVHWKTARVVEHAAGRPFAWIDDELGDPDHTYVAAAHRAPALLHQVNPRLGLLPPDFDRLSAFAATLTS